MWIIYYDKRELWLPNRTYSVDLLGKLFVFSSYCWWPKKHIQEFSKSIYVLDTIIGFFKMLNALVENLNANNSEMSRSYRRYWRYERQKQGMKLRTLRNPEHEYISNLGISTGIAETWIAISYWLCLFKHVKMNFGYILAKFDIFFPKILFPI